MKNNNPFKVGDQCVRTTDGNHHTLLPWRRKGYTFMVKDIDGPGVYDYIDNYHHNNSIKLQKEPARKPINNKERTIRIKDIQELCVTYYKKGLNTEPLSDKDIHISVKEHLTK